MKAQSKAKATFKIPMNKTHASNGPAVPATYAQEMSRLNRSSSRAMRVARRGR